MHKEHGWTRIRGKNLNTQLFVGFGIVLIVFEIMEINK